MYLLKKVVKNMTVNEFIRFWMGIECELDLSLNNFRFLTTVDTYIIFININKSSHSSWQPKVFLNVL